MRAARAVLALLVGLLLAAGSLAAESPSAAQQPDVRRLAGSDRTATAAAVALDGWSTADVAVISDGWDPVSALVAAHLAARVDAPLLLGSSDHWHDATAAALQDLDPRDLVVVGGPLVPDDVVPGEVERIVAGTPATLAAAALDARPGSPDMPVILASRATFADALSAASLAPARLLLTDPSQLSDPAAEVIRATAPDQVVLVGGEAALAPAVADAVADLGPDVRRVAGSTRYLTALATAAGRDGPAVLASGQDFADAVAIVPWAARRGAGVLLTTHPELPDGVATHLADHQPPAAVVTGGTSAVGNFVDRQVAAAITGSAAPGFASAIRPLTDAEREGMTGVVWQPGCPVGLDDLRVLELSHWGMDGNVVDDGRLVLHTDHVADVATVMAALFDARFRVHQVVPVEAYGGDDDASMAANNTSAFNCRPVAGTSTWSQHAYGAAVDVNPVQNPYVRGQAVEPAEGRAYLDRTDVRPGMVVRPGPVTDAFAAIGWGWGADFTTSDDYQHFSANGR